MTFFHGVFGATASIVLDPQLESPGADSACSWTFEGDCGFRTGCEEQPTSALDAGDVSLTSPDVAGSFSSSFTEGAYPPDHGNFETRLSGGEALHLAATGGADLASFVIDIAFPLLALIDEPILTGPDPLTVVTGNDVEVGFRRGSANTWLYATAATGSGEARRELLCAANGDPGTLLIPKAALEHIGVGVEIDFFTVSVAEVNVEGVGVHFWVGTEATTEERQFAYRMIVE